MFYFVLFLIVSSSTPKIQLLYLNDELTNDEAEALTKKAEERYESDLEKCKRTADSKYCEMFPPVMYGNRDTAYEQLASLKVDGLIMVASLYNDAYNFGRLKEKVQYAAIQHLPRESAKLLSQTGISILKSKAKAFIKQNPDFSADSIVKNLVQSFFFENIPTSHSKRVKAGDDHRVYLNGRESNGMVSYLYVYGQEFKVTDGGFHCDTLFIETSITETSDQIQVKNLIVGKDYVSNLNWDKLTIDHFMISLLDYNYNGVRISYSEDAWNLYYQQSGSQYYDTYLNIPYTKAKSYGVVTYDIYNFDIYCDIANAIDNIKSLNITVGIKPTLGDTTEVLEEKSKQTIKITKSGDGWDNQNSKPKIVIVADKDKFEVDSSGAEGFSVTHDKPYVFKKKKGINIPMIIGIVVAVVVVIVIIIVVAVVCHKRKKKARSSSQTE